jgi:hypothetical protein
MIMNFKQLLEHCDVDVLAMDTEGYDSWVPKDSTVILTVSDLDSTWQRVNFLQLLDQKKMYGEDKPLLLAMQLDGQPDCPNNTTNLDSIAVRIFKEI